VINYHASFTAKLTMRNSHNPHFINFRSLLLVFVIAAAVRIFALFLVFEPSTSFMKYFDLAEDLIRNHWTPRSAFAYSPIYTYFLALVIYLFGRAYLLVALLQCFLGAASCALIAAATSAAFGSSAGLIGGLIAALCQPFVLYDTEFLSDSFGVFLLCCTMLASLSAFLRPRSARLWFISGLACGLSALQRPNMLLFAALFPLLALRSPRVHNEFRKRLLCCVVFLLSFALPVFPIVVQNYVACGEIIPITCEGGYVFYCSNNYASTGLRYSPPPLVKHEMYREPGGTEDYIALMDEAVSRRVASVVSGRPLKPGQASRFWLFEGLNAIRNMGTRYLWLLLSKAYYILNAYEAHDTIPIYFKLEKLRSIPLIPMAVISPLILVGFFVSLPRRRDLLPLYMLCAVQLATMLVFYVVSRFRLFLVAASLPFAAYLLSWFIEQLKTRRWRNCISLLTALLCVGIVVNIKTDRIREDSRRTRMTLLTLLARSDYHSGRFSHALRRLQRVLRSAHFPRESMDAHRLLLQIYRALGEKELAAREARLLKGMLSNSELEVLSHCLSSEKCARKRAQYQLILGRHYLEVGNIASGISYLERSILSNPLDPLSHFLLAKALSSLPAPDAEEISSEIEKALQLNLKLTPHASEAYSILARCYEMLGRHEDSREAREKAFAYRSLSSVKSESGE